MLAASVTLLVASDHEQRAFLHPSDAARRCTGGVVSVARSRRRGIGGFLSSIFSNRTESLACEDRWRRNDWKRALVATVIVTLGIAIVEGIFRLTHFQSFRTGVILVSLILTAVFPQMVCDSVAPFLRPRISFVDGHVAIRGERLTSIGHLLSYMLFLAFAMFFIISGFITHELVRTFHFALIPACFAYFLCSMNPLRDFTATLSDRSTTTLAPEGITFHMAHHLSVDADLESASSGCGSDASFRWDQNVKIYDLSTTSYHVDLFADPDTYDGPWSLCCRTIGIPFTGLDALIRHFNEHPEDRPLLATPQGVDLVNDILAEAHMELTTPQRSHA